ncbi:MAG: hypothetical protein GWN77_03190, partial [Gammaproteobacteria bacterium]|nr:hypothetical protein [Gammaproteobacteria bacterium]NIU93147.1 hypothetical protein [candidate division KSB1 bacterium]NIW71483.1 hypothetical protein [candidate division KSB1 bacterium]
RQGFKWFGSGDGPYKLAKDNVTWALEPTDAPDCVQGTIWSMVEDYEGNLWFGTSDGAPRLDPVNM